MYGTLDISTSGLVAQRARLDAIAANLANMNTILDSSGKVNPYRRKEVFFAPGSPGAASAEGRSFGVHIAAIQEERTLPTPREYDPDNPFAYKDGPWKGYVAGTNVNPMVEMVNQVDAARAYEANIMAAEATKQMMASALRLIA